MPTYNTYTQNLVFSSQTSQSATIVTGYENLDVFIGDLYISSSSAPFSGIATLTFYDNADMADNHIVWISQVQLNYNSLAASASAGDSSITLNSAAGFAQYNQVQIFNDGTNPTENRRVQSVSTNTLNLMQVLSNNHLSTAAVANLAEFGGISLQDVSNSQNVYVSVSFSSPVSLTLTLDLSGISISASLGADVNLDNLASPTAINQDLLFGADNTNNIGASSANRPANIWAATAITAPSLVGSLTGNASGTASDITTTSNSTLLTLSALTTASSLTTVGTITSGVWNGTAITVPNGGTGLTTLTAYALLTGGTTSTGNLQQVSGVGTSGQVLTSNGSAALPTWQTPAGGGFTYFSSNTSVYGGTFSTLSSATGANNTVVGVSAGNSLTTAIDNTFLGYQAGKAVVTGSSNTFVGYNAGVASTGGTITMLGSMASPNLVTASQAIIIGYKADNTGAMTTGDGNFILIGTENNITTGSSAGSMNGNVIVGNNCTIGYGYGNNIGLGQVTLGGSSNYSIAIGMSSTSNNTNSIAIGFSALCNGQYAVALGRSTSITGTYSVGLGANNSDGGGVRNIIIGAGLAMSGSNAECFVAGVCHGTPYDPTTASHQISFGTSGASPNTLSDMFLGRGAAGDTVATNVSIQPTPIASGNSNTAGANLSLRGGNGTGTGAGGSIILQTAPPSSSSSTPNTLTTALQVDGHSNVVVGTGSALSTSATQGFLYVPTCAGLPTGTPSQSYTGSSPLVLDTTAEQLYWYNGGAWISSAGFSYYGSATSVYGGTNSVLTATGTNSVVIGVGAGANLTTSISNVIIGYQAGAALTTRNGNLLIGQGAGVAYTGGASIIIGTGPSNTLSSGDEIIMIGTACDQTHVLTGSDSNFVIVGSENTLANGAMTNGVFVGNGFTVSGTGSAVGLGNNVSVGTENIAIGTSATANSSSQIIAIGFLTKAQGQQSIVIGSSGYIHGKYSIGIGTGAADGGAPYSIILGSSNITNSAHQNCFVVGNTSTFVGNDTTTAPNQITFGTAGTNALPMTDMFLGRGAVGDATASNVSLQPSPVVGSNLAGANLSLRAGNSTGTGVGGSLLLQTAPAGSTGSTANTLVTALTVDGYSNVVVGTGAALATNATQGFAYLPSCAGVPTGTPSQSYTGSLAVVIDSVSGQLYYWTGSAWATLA